MKRILAAACVAVAVIVSLILLRLLPERRGDQGTSLTLESRAPGMEGPLQRDITRADPMVDRSTRADLPPAAEDNLVDRAWANDEGVSPAGLSPEQRRRAAHARLSILVANLELHEASVPEALRSPYEGIVAVFRGKKESLNVWNVPNWRGIVFNDLFSGATAYRQPWDQRDRYADAWTAVLNAMGVKDLDLTTRQWFSAVMERYSTLAEECSKEVNASFFEPGERPLNSPHLEEAWDARIERYERLFDLLISELERGLPADAFQKFIAPFLDLEEL